MKRTLRSVRQTGLALILAFSFVLFVGRALAQPEIIAKFIPRSHTFQGTTLVYRLFIPEGYDPSKRYPVVLALHGNTNQGSDNLIHIQGTRLATSWADSVNQAKYPCFVVAPQCREGYYWTDKGTMTPDLATANNILDALVSEFSIDTTRMYVTGLSMGGFASWFLMTTLPERFAAAVPVSAGWWGFLAYRIGDIPIWTFMGAQDAIVPVASVRDIIEGLRQRGRSVVYTRCYNGDCTGLTDNAIAASVENRADLFYTETQDGQHDVPFFNFAYDYPLLRPWVFSKIRPTRGLVTLTNLKSYRVLRGVEQIIWAASNPSDSVQIRFSPDGGFTWQLVAASLPNTGSYMWNTQNVKDCAFGLLKIFLKNPARQIYGYDLSGYLAINNGIQGKPLAKILNLDSFAESLIDSNTVALQYLAGNSKPGPLSVQFFYSVDGGAGFSQFDGYTAERDTTSKMRTVNLAALPNADKAILRIDVSDGVSVSSDTTPLPHPFIKRTPRLAGPATAHVAGAGGGRITVNIVNPAEVTGNLYRVILNDALPGYKFYDVFDVTTGAKVVSRATQLDGKAEGPRFDGIRLLVQDTDHPTVDQDNSKWEGGTPTLLNVKIVLPTIHNGSQDITAYPYPADYRVSFFDHVVDTSSNAIFGTPRIPINFRTWNLTENRKVEVIFNDADNNQQVSSGDEVLIVEPDSQGVPRMTWDLVFSSVPPATLAPKAGDQFVLRTLKPFHTGDTFEFRGIVSSVSATSLPEATTLFQNYPNPFNPTTRIRFQIANPSHVRLTVYDVLGREVATLVNEELKVGSYERTFEGNRLASGVYLYRLESGNIVNVKKLLLLK